jgi:hypothetical protein
MQFAVVDLLLLGLLVGGAILAWAIAAERRLERRRERWLMGEDRFW